MDKAPFIFFIFFIFFLHNETRGQDSVIVLSEQGVLPAEQEEGNSELAELMKEIEANFSTLKDLLEFS